MLLGNHSVLSKMPVRFRGGSTTAVEVNVIANYQGSGPRRNRFYVSGQTTAYKTLSVPTGYYPPGAWIIPQVSGELGAVNALVGVGSAIANLAGGRNAQATVTGAGDITNALAGLIVSLAATISGSGDLTDADLKAFLNAVATLAGSGDLSAAIGAIASVTASASGAGTLAGTSTATGALGATIRSYGDLTPEGLANAVWSAIAAQYNVSGSMGELLNSAGSAADPLLGVVEGGLTLRDVMRILLAVGGGDATGLESGTMTFKAQDGTTTRVQATYSSGDRTITTLDPT